MLLIPQYLNAVVFQTGSILVLGLFM